MSGKPLTFKMILKNYSGSRVFLKFDSIDLIVFCNRPQNKRVNSRFPVLKPYPG
jgi:hypothetical protein